jgi:NAD(P)-dependent dehydrogenase (short-subunit alcohol dehydrogenase family)
VFNMKSNQRSEARPVALVTGGARRIGRAIALELAANGWDVALHYRHSAQQADATVEELRALGAQAFAFRAELGDAAELEGLLPAVVERHGRVDAVVNNASLFEHDDVASFTAEVALRHFNANVTPAIVLARALHQHVRSQGCGGCVVNLLDQKLWNSNPDHLSYTLSKAALEAASKLLAQALAPALRVCGVAPGVTLPSGPMSEQEFAQAHRMTPLERSSTPQDVASAVRFLLESPAMTGSTLLVDGGQHLSPQPRDVLFLVRQQK